MVASNYFKMDERGKRIGVVQVNKLRRLFPLLPSWVIRRKVFERVGLFDERLLLSEDVEFFARFRKRSFFHFIEQPLLIKHRSKDSTFSDMEKVIGIRKKYLQELRSDRRLYARHLNYLGKDFLHIG
jgi:GT2 family glycosyltransferase